MGMTAARTAIVPSATTAILSAALLLSAISTPAEAQEPVETLRRGLYDDATLTVHLRSYYLDRTNPAPPNNAAWAGGGWLGYESGWFYDFFRFGAVGYTSQPLSAGSDGTLLLQPGPLGYTVLGQAYGKLKLFGQEFTGYRQLINQPEVNPQDNRMTPNTFEAYTLTGNLGDVSYFAGYVANMKPRNATEFFNMATIAGAPPGVSEGMILGGLSYVPEESLKARLSSYYVPDILVSAYGDVSKSFSLANDVDVRIGAQMMVQGSNGANLLTGRPFSTWAGGLDVDLIYKYLTLTATYTQTGSAGAYRTPYGTWAGYTSMIVKDFDRANEGAALVGATLDLGLIKAPGFAFTTNAVFGNGAINAVTGALLPINNEYDFTLDYLFANSALNWPDWMRPFWLRGRIALVDQFLNGSYTSIRDYRVILNYEWKFGGKDH